MELLVSYVRRFHQIFLIQMLFEVGNRMFCAQSCWFRVNLDRNIAL